MKFVSNLLGNRTKAKGFNFLMNLVRERKYPQLWEIDMTGRKKEGRSGSDE